MGAPIEKVLPSMLERFSKGVRRTLNDPWQQGEMATAIRTHKEKLGTDLVPSFMSVWRAKEDETGQWKTELSIT